MGDFAKVCSICGKTKVLKDFAVSSGGTTLGVCKACLEKMTADEPKEELSPKEQKKQEERRERWGTGEFAKGLPFTEEIYEALEKQYENRAASYKGTTLTPQMIDTLVKVCKWNYLIDHYIAVGEIETASKLQKMVDTALASESMRRKDEKPVEAARIDALVVALEKAGAIKNHKFVGKDELIKVLQDKFIKSKKYKDSLDCADQIINDFYNNMRINAGMYTVSELPEDLKPEDEYGEFSDTPSERELKGRRYAGLTPVQFEGDK